MSFIYDLFFIIFLIISLPAVILQLIFTGKYRQSLKPRLGLMSSELWQRIKGTANKKVIWLHAVSVGEMLAASSLLPDIRQQFSDYRLIISTTTETGQAIAKQKIKEGAEVIYFPLDLSFIARYFIRHINPSLFIIMETEIWPNMIQQMALNHTRIVMINGRLSPRSYKGYKAVRYLIAPLLKHIDLLCMQTKSDAEKIISLGAPAEKVKVTGNIKIDQALVKEPAPQDLAVLRDKLFIKEEDKVLAAGSTHPGEEKIILEVYKKLRLDFPDLKLIIAPRHIERTVKIEKIVSDFNYQAFRYTDLLNISIKKAPQVIILDKIGVLREIYSLATIVFMGGSLIKHGGQNMLEPAALAKPVIYGPHIYNFQDITEMFLKARAQIMVYDKKELEHTCSWLLSSPEQARVLGSKAREVVEQNTGAVKNNIEVLKSLLII
ncbi:MAG: 3-deoxy-D-manno-octulosonic acid transferase [Candidatus Omnitrophica bacterium]|nr:3-deoxy-D-manno-octulosonic acid transferase [Candidatus Omnitrophota bacterium]